MPRVRISLFLLFLLWPLLPFGQGSGQVVLLDVKDIIGPATSDYVKRSLDKAMLQQAPLVILRMDTPGGLDISMRDIIQAIIASPVPVVTYVGPSGARAASAGTYILYASHVAAMAPGTNLGAATPVQLGGGGDADNDKETGKTPTTDQSQEHGGDAMKKKMVNDAVAYIRSLAQLRGRNAEWAEQAVREAVSLPAEDALKKGVIEIVAADVSDLLVKLDGRKVSVLGQEYVLATHGLSVQIMEPDWRTRLLAIITHPNIAYLLMMIGIYGLLYEFANPGMVLPGVAGAISLLLALFAFQVLPINYAGFALMLLGIAFIVGEIFMPSFGALGIGGVIAFVVGSIMLMDTDVPGFGISLSLIGAFALVSAAFIFLVVGMAVKAWRRPIVSGREQMIGSLAEVVEDFSGIGKVYVHGEIWEARSQILLQAGQKVRVTALKGLTLIVAPDNNMLHTKEN